MDNHMEPSARGAEVELGRKEPPALPPVRAVDWQSVKEALRERYVTEIRLANGVDMTERGQDGLERVRRRLAYNLAATGRAPDELDMLFLQNYGFGAAELINEYMRKRP